MNLHGRINDKTRPAQPLSAVLVGPSCTTPTTSPFESPKANTPAGLSMARAASASSRPTIPKAIIDVVTCGITRSMQRSEEHTSELQSRGHLVCRLLLEKKKQ